MARINRGALQVLEERQRGSIERRRESQAKADEQLQKRLDADLDFQRRLTQAAISSGQSTFDPTTGDISQREAQTLPSLADLQEGETVTLRDRGLTRTLKKPIPKAEVEPKPLAPRVQARQSVVEAQQGLSTAQQAPVQGFIPQAQEQLQGALPQTPFVPGPQGGFITSGQPIDPQSQGIVPREQVVNRLAPGIAPGLQQQGIQQAQGLVTQSIDQARLLGAIPRPKQEDDIQAELQRIIGGGVQPQAAQAPTPGQQVNFQEEVNDLVQAMQNGIISTREQAIAVITEAGLDPNSPEFAQIISQLP